MTEEYISDWLLEKYLLKELPQEKLHKIEKIIQTNKNINKRLEHIKKSNNEILKNYPATKIIPLINKNIQRRQKEKNFSFSLSKKRMIPAFTLSFAILFLGLVFLIKPYINKEKILIKGEGQKLFIYKKSGSKIIQLTNNSLAREKDLLQIAYQSIEDKYGVIFSLDGDGIFTLQFPENINSSTRLKSTKKEFLKSSYELDDAPVFEKFFFITSSKKIDIQKIIAIIKKYKKNNLFEKKLREKYKITAFTIKKEDKKP